MSSLLFSRLFNSKGAFQINSTKLSEPHCHVITKLFPSSCLVLLHSFVTRILAEAVSSLARLCILIFDKTPVLRMWCFFTKDKHHSLKHCAQYYSDPVPYLYILFTFPICFDSFQHGHFVTVCGKLENPTGLECHITWSACMSIIKALRLQDMSCSPSRKLWISSGASGIRKSKFLKRQKKKKNKK